MAVLDALPSPLFDQKSTVRAATTVTAQADRCYTHRRVGRAPDIFDEIGVILGLHAAPSRHHHLDPQLEAQGGHLERTPTGDVRGAPAIPERGPQPRRASPVLPRLRRIAVERAAETDDFDAHCLERGCRARQDGQPFEPAPGARLQKYVVHVGMPLFRKTDDEFATTLHAWLVAWAAVDLRAIRVDTDGGGVAFQCKVQPVPARAASILHAVRAKLGASRVVDDCYRKCDGLRSRCEEEACVLSIRLEDQAFVTEAPIREAKQAASI